MVNERPETFYEQHYAAGGPVYDLDVERRMLADVVAPLSGWELSPGRIIEVGAGAGHHAELLRIMGYRVTAVELSEAGVKSARSRYPALKVVQADAASWSPGRWRGNVFARGMSWFHYGLRGVNRFGVDVPDQTARIFSRWMNPGDAFTLQIVTDLSGAAPENRVHNNTIDDFRYLFEPLGRTYIYDWSGRKLYDSDTGVSADTSRHDRGVIVVARKP